MYNNMIYILIKSVRFWIRFFAIIKKNYSSYTKSKNLDSKKISLKIRNIDRHNFQRYTTQLKSYAQNWRASNTYKNKTCQFR